MRRWTSLAALALAAAAISACGGGGGGPPPQPVPAGWGADLPGQPAYPAFPTPGQHWVIDAGCHFDAAAVASSDAAFEKLRLDGVAEVAVLCVPGVKELGGANDGLIWLRNWTRHVRLGSAGDDRSIAFLIRPDIDPARGDRVVAEQSVHLYLSVVDYGPIVENAADWANAGQFTGALSEITRDIDAALRLRAAPTPTPTV